MEEREKYRTFLEMSGGETSSKTLLEGSGEGGTAPGTNWRGMEEREHLMDLQQRSGGEEHLQDLLESREGEGKAPGLTRN